MLKITATGYITSDFALRTRPEDESPYAIIRIGSTRRYRDRDGKRLTDYVSVKVRGALAERCAAQLTKGCRIIAAGDFETITTPDENGAAQRTGFIIKANDVQLLAPAIRQADAEQDAAAE